MQTETDPDYIAADRILEDGDARWFRQRIAGALKAEREVERERCEALVQAARLEPTDLRSIAHMIRNPSPK